MTNVEDGLKKQTCPSCYAELVFSERYPGMICYKCGAKLTDIKGRKVEYCNVNPPGTGCQGYYSDSNWTEKYDSDICYIGNDEFFAQEARFGGIVVQKR